MLPKAMVLGLLLVSSCVTAAPTPNPSPAPTAKPVLDKARAREIWSVGMAGVRVRHTCGFHIMVTLYPFAPAAQCLEVIKSFETTCTTQVRKLNCLPAHDTVHSSIGFEPPHTLNVGFGSDWYDFLDKDPPKP